MADKYLTLENGVQIIFKEYGHKYIDRPTNGSVTTTSSTLTGI